MNRRLIPLLLVAAVWPTGCNSVPPEAPLAADEIFPLEEGRIHVFRNVERGGPATMTVQDISKGHGYWSLEFSSDSSERFLLALVRDSTGVSITVIGIGHGAVPFDPPLLLVPPSVVDGVSWSSIGKIGSKRPEDQKELAKERARNPQMESLEFSTQGATRSIPIVVGDKSYRARSVEIFISTKDPKGQRVRAVWLRLWLASGVGVVKVDFGQKGPDDLTPTKTWELTEIKHKP